MMWNFDYLQRNRLPNSYLVSTLIHFENFIRTQLRKVIRDHCFRRKNFCNETNFFVLQIYKKGDHG